MDRRTIKTRRVIRETFLTLLETKGVGQITVAEITRLSDLGRGTFYLHYKDVFDLYNSIESELCDDLVRLFDEAYPSSDPKNLIKFVDGMTRYMEQHRDIFLLLSQQENKGQVFASINKAFIKKLLAEPPEVDSYGFDIVEAMFAVSGVVGVIEEWLVGELPLSRRQLSRMMLKVLIRIPRKAWQK